MKAKSCFSLDSLISNPHAHQSFFTINSFYNPRIKRKSTKASVHKAKLGSENSFNNAFFPQKLSERERREAVCYKKKSQEIKRLFEVNFSMNPFFLFTLFFHSFAARNPKKTTLFPYSVTGLDCEDLEQCFARVI
jgi:hypothetical protein